MGVPPGVVVLFGPKAVGKSTIARLLQQYGGVYHVDPDALVLTLIAAGGQPDPDTGWLHPVEQAVRVALARHHRWVAVEATGAWESDWALVDHLERSGTRVVRVWVVAPLQTTLERLAERTEPTVRISEQEARRVFMAASARAANERIDSVIDSGADDPLRAALGLLDLLSS